MKNVSSKQHENQVRSHVQSNAAVFCLAGVQPGDLETQLAILSFHRPSGVAGVEYHSGQTIPCRRGEDA